MVAPNGDQSHNNSSRYPTIRRLEASDARMPSGSLVRNLNPDFNVVRVQAIIETIQRMVPDDCPLAVLAQQGADAANLVSAEKSAGVPRREPSINNNQRRRQVQIATCPSMMHSDASPRTAPCGNTVVNGMTSAMSLKIGGISGSEHHPYHNDP
jgi:hypothetical protein